MCLNKKDNNIEEKKDNLINKNDSYLSENEYFQGIHSLSEIIINLNEMDRKRIARELHDSTIQNMVCMIHKVELASRFIDTDPIRVKLELSTMKKLLKENIDELRGLVYDLRPMSFDDLGFDVLLKQYLDELDQLYDNEIEYHYDADLVDVKENCLITIYRVIKECCINSIKHSGGAKLSVSITEDKDNLVICVSDNGKGFDLTKEADKYHYGLRIMEDRVTLLKGKVKITSELGKGYETKIVIPFKVIK